MIGTTAVHNNDLPGDVTGDAIADCGIGSKVFGGGGRITDTAPQRDAVHVSYPLDDHRWLVNAVTVVSGIPGGSSSITAFAVCTVP